MEKVLGLPKAELHLHLFGCFRSQMIYDIAKRNGIQPEISLEEYQSIQQNFNCLDDLLKLIRLNFSVINSASDYYSLAMDGLSVLKSQNVVYAEPAFNIISLTNPSISPSAILDTLTQVAIDMETLHNIKINWLLEFSRGDCLEEQFKLLSSISSYKDIFKGIGVAANEFNHPSRDLKPIYDLARNLGFCGLDGKYTTAHTGEEAPVNFVHETLDYLNVERIDHGIRTIDDPLLVKKLGERHFPIAMAPISNRKLKVLERFCPNRNVYEEFYKAGCCVSINSDDPGLLNSWINESLTEFYNDYKSEDKDTAIVEVVKNGFRSAFLSEEEKQRWIREIDLSLRKNEE
ncbi:hypothetical protein SteCoe_13760 [Stentor coeruleus]|uniref:Adenosine deaminase n=1 Tax=Stentor coeruleus TaxID=5963 RepID=A0A1R2C7P5_9CILI|nr:hypothetical protein SteCoe_13760 [Stentor coeruleus]